MRFPMTTIPPSVSIVRWPDAHAALGEGYAHEWSRRVKYALRCWLTLRARRLVLAHVARSSAASSLLANFPRALYPVMHKHLDRRFDSLERARTMVASIDGMEKAVGTDLANDLCAGRELTLAELPDATRITLNLNRLTFHEGLWAVDLTRADGLRLFTISFGWFDAGTLMIACVQGPPREIDGLQCVRELTSVAHGLRPGHLLIHVLRACAGAWGVTTLVGVDEAFQVKGRWNHKAQERRFDYAAFWAEAAGVRFADGNWRLPVSVPQRALDDVPAKRRAMYRRRHALLADMAPRIANALGQRNQASPTAVSQRGPGGIAP